MRHVDWRFSWRVGWTIWLPIWFVLIDVVHIVDELGFRPPPGVDAVLYRRAAEEFLRGGSPWAASIQGGPDLTHFAGLPPTVLAFVPFAMMPEWLAASIWVGLSVVAAVAIVRRLHLPIWWLAFPPLVEGVYSGNPQLVILALLVCLPRLSWFAPLLKVYAVFPLAGERRWRALAISALAVAATFVIAPTLWIEYFNQAGSIAARLEVEARGGFSASADPGLWALTILSLILLALVDLRSAGWLAVPGAWPASQFHYSTFAMPIATPLLGYLLAPARYDLVPFVVMGFTAVRLVQLAPGRLAAIRAWSTTPNVADGTARPAPVKR
jgi:hypothetical protein